MKRAPKKSSGGHSVQVKVRYHISSDAKCLKFSAYCSKIVPFITTMWLLLLLSLSLVAYGSTENMLKIFIKNSCCFFFPRKNRQKDLFKLCFQPNIAINILSMHFCNARALYKIENGCDGFIKSTKMAFPSTSEHNYYLMVLRYYVISSHSFK